MCQLFDAQPGGHPRCHEPQDPNRLLANDVRAQVGMGGTFDDQVAEAFGIAVDHVTVHLGVGHDGDQAIMLGTGLGSVRPTLPYSGSVKPP